MLLRMRRYTGATRKVDPKYRELCKSLPNFRAAVFPGSVWGELLGFRISGFQRLGVPFGGPYRVRIIILQGLCWCSLFHETTIRIACFLPSEG